MTEKPTPTPHSTFTVSSGCLCYGLLHNMCHGLTLPTQPFPSAVESPSHGTVRVQIVHYNIAALNGTWHAYELVSTRSNQCTAWFVCHDSVNPESEVDKILRVSGSPYEFDSGSQWHSDKTVQEGVLPINRYDWGYYDYRCKDQVPDVIGIDNVVWQGHGLGLVDFAHARDYIALWKNLPPPQRECQAHGLWMNVVQEEYMFGRFGFTDDHKVARSFLWFTKNTEFPFTAFAGLETTLRVFESLYDRMSRLLREGYNMNGLQLIQKDLKEYQESGEVPPDGELRGPYNTADYILDARDADLIAVKAQNLPWYRANDDCPPRHLSAYWRSACLEVINEALLSYLDTLFTSTSYDTDETDRIGSVAASLFPKHGEQNTIDKWMYMMMVDPDSSSSAMSSRAAFAEKIMAFLKSRGGFQSDGMFIVDGFANGLAAAVEWLCGEILELAGNCAIDHYRKGVIVPLDIRLAIRNDSGLTETVGCSRVCWLGGTQGWVDVGQDV